MEKVLVALHVLSVNECFDMWLPTFLPLEELLPLLLDLIKDSVPYNYYPSERPILCCKDQNMLLDDMQLTLSDYGIMNGDSLFLF